MTSSKDEIITQQANVISPDELAEVYKRWQAPRMVSVSDVDDGLHDMLTVDDIEKLQKQAEEDGYKQGFEKGKNEGYQAGLTAGQQEIRQQVALLQQIMSSLNSPLADLDKQVEKDLLELVITMTRQLVHRELTIRNEDVITLVRTAMAALPVSDRKVKLFLHPSDIELVKAGLSLESNELNWQWVEDPMMTRGGTRIETADTTVDATVESRLTNVINKLLGKESSNDGID